MNLAIGLLLLVALLFAGALSVHATTRPGTAVHIAWLAGGVPSDEVAPVYAAYLRRHRNARILGGLAGLAVACLGAWRWNESFILSVGVGLGPIGGDLLVGVLAGMTLGTLAAESYRLSPPALGQRQALLDARPARPRPEVTRIARVLIVLAVATGAIALALGNVGPLGGAVLALLIGLLAELTQRAITDRRRPAGALAAHVDGRLRSFSGASVAWLQLAGGVLGLGWALAAVDVPVEVEPFMVLVTLATLVTALVALIKSAVRPPRRWTPGVLPA